MAYRTFSPGDGKLNLYSYRGNQFKETLALKHEQINHPPKFKKPKLWGSNPRNPNPNKINFFKNIQNLPPKPKPLNLILKKKHPNTILKHHNGKTNKSFS